MIYRTLLILLTACSLQAATPLTGPWPTAVQYNRTNLNLGPNGLSAVFSNIYITNFDAGITAAGTTTKRTLSEKLSETFVSVKDFGAIGDGSAQDGLAIQAALDASTDGKIIFFPAGTYNFTNQLVLPANYRISLRGVKELASILRFQGTNSVAVTTSGSSGSDGGYEIENLMIQNASGNTGGTNGVVLENGQQYLRLRNVIISQFSQGIGLQINKTYSGYLEKVYITECKQAVKFGGTSGSDFINNFQAKNLHIENCTDTNYVAQILTAKAFSWEGGVCQNNVSGILVQDSAAVKISGIFFEENGTTITNAGNAELHWESNQGGIIENNYFNGDDPAAIDYAALKIGRTISGDTGPLIQGNVIVDYQYAYVFQSAFSNIKSLRLVQNYYNNNTSKFRFVHNLNSGEYIYEDADGKVYLYDNGGNLLFGINDTLGTLRFQGTDATTKPTVSSVTTFTDNSNTKPWLFEHQLSPSTNTANTFYGFWDRPEHGGTKDAGGFIGRYIGTRNVGTGALPVFGAAVVEVDQAGGVISEGYGMKFLPPKQTSGTFSAWKSLWLQDSGIAGTYSFYNEGPSYFAKSILANHLTASRLVVTDSGKLLTNSVVTATEAGYLSGVTNAIQTQLNAKQSAFTTAIGVTNISDVLSVVLGAGSNITFATNGNRIDISAAASSGEANTGANVASGSGVYAGMSGTVLQFNTLTGANGIQVSSNANLLTISVVTTNDITIGVTDPISTITTGTAKQYWDATKAMTLKSVRCTVGTQSSSGVITVNVKKNGTTIFSTKPTIDATETSTSTAATASVLSTTAVALNDRLTFDVDDAGTGAKNLQVTLYFVGE
jgi:hypothetical protein